MTEVELFRRQKDQFFKTHPHSPLLPEQQSDFQGLQYFPPNPALRFEVEVDEFSDKTHVVMQTSTGDTRPYVRYGQVTFSVDGEQATLTLYGDNDSFFLPFADALAGSETYGAGRYLEPQPLGDGRFLIDFNLAYNPYCAYNDGWSCPITPPENRLQLPIRAGEKVFVVGSEHHNAGANP
jgi:uncharacterized protein